MDRTTIMLPPDLKRRALQRAKELGISFGEFVRTSLGDRLRTPKKGKGQERDPFFADEEFYEGPSPGDWAENHDRYLYGEDAE